MERRQSATTLRGATLIGRLLGEGSDRPRVDPGLAGGLRDWLEDELAAPVAALGDQNGPVRVTKETLNQVLVCESHLVARRGAPRRMTEELARGSLVDAAFRQWITTGRLDDPWADSLAAMEATGDSDGVVAFVGALPSARRHALADELAAHGAVLTAAWPVPSPTWLARTQERLTVPLAGGRIVMSGVVDLAFGAPSSGNASVCIVEVKSGRRKVEHRGDLHLYALMETLRSGAPPFRVATYYTATGELDVEPVGREVLVGALHRVHCGATALCRLAAGGEPARSPNALCGWCAGLASCPPGRARVEMTSGGAPPAGAAGGLTDDDEVEDTAVEEDATWVSP